MSLMKTSNKRGPRTDPCGTPTVTSLYVLHEALMLTTLMDKRQFLKTG